MKKQTIIIAGSGSGGHIKPLTSVAKEIKKQNSNVQLVYVGQKGDRFTSIIKDSEDIDKTLSIFAGKFRRFHGLGFKQILNIERGLKNIRDVFYVLVGLIQSCLILRKYKPVTVFIKGGYIGVPLGLAAARRKIPIVTHDSDAYPGLANRLISKWVDTHAVALPIENYQYPKEDTVQVGVPVPDIYNTESYNKSDIGLDNSRPLILVMGGSLGAVRINTALNNHFKELQELAQVVHVTGHKNFDDFKDFESDTYKPLPFTDEIHKYILAADVIVMRAGATALAEVCAAHKPVIIIPNPYLTAGHQTANAKLYDEKGAAVYISEDELDSQLIPSIRKLLKLNDVELKEIYKAQDELYIRDSAKKLADLILSAAKRGGM